MLTRVQFLYILTMRVHVRVRVTSYIEGAHARPGASHAHKPLIGGGERVSKEYWKQIKPGDDPLDWQIWMMVSVMTHVATPPSTSYFSRTLMGCTDPYTGVVAHPTSVLLGW